MENYDEDDVGDCIYPAMAAYHAEADWNQPSFGITSKIPPLFNGTSSWFQYEELIDDWIDLTTLDEEKHGPALKNRLFGEVALYKTLLDRNILKSQDGVKHFK